MKDWRTPSLDRSMNMLNLDHIRPSVKRKFLNNIRDGKYGIQISLSAFVAMTEGEARAKADIDVEDFDKIKSYLEEYGLHFGMTHEEMDEYRDKEYYEDHPEERSDYVSESVKTGEDIFMEEQLREMFVNEKLEEANENNSLTLEDVPEWDEDAADRKFSRFIVRTSFREFTTNDVEWIRARLIGDAMLALPWYYRFLPIAIRMKRVKEDFEASFDVFAKDLKQRMIAEEKHNFLEYTSAIKQKNDEKEKRIEQIRKAANEEFDRKYKSDLSVPALEPTFNDEFDRDEFIKCLVNTNNERYPQIVATPIYDDL